MQRRTIGVLCGMILATTGLGDPFPTQFQAAMQLVHSGQSAAAEEAFVKLAEQKPSPRGIDASLAQAAHCAIAQKKYDKATEYAGRIEEPSLNKLCRMLILQAQNKRQELLALSKDEDIEKWPDALIYDGLLCRGRTHAAEKDAGNAGKDLLAAIKNTVSADNKAFAYLFLGDLHRDSRDNQKALDAYGEIAGLHPSSRFVMRAAMARAKLLAAEGKGDEALSELDRLEAGKVKDPYWPCAVALCKGDVFTALGKNAEALASYRTAEAITNAPADFLVEAKAKAAKIEQVPQP